MKKSIFLLSLSLFLCQFALAQTGGINFQGLARNASGEVLVNQKITLRFSVLLSSETGATEYQESKEATTNAQGMFSLVIGEGSILNKTGNFSDINWKVSPKFLKVEMDPSAGSNFTLMGTSKLQAVPFAYYANGVDAENVQGVLPAAKGGTGVASISALKGALQLDQVSNTSDANKPLSTATQTALATKVDKVEGKDLSTNDYSTAEKTKLAAITGTNTGDQDLSGLATTTALATKANAGEVTTALDTKVDKVEGKTLSTNDFSTAEKTKLAAITGTNTGDQDLSGLATTTALATKANAAEVTTALDTKVDKVEGKALSSNDYSTAEKTKLAAISGTNTGDQDLSGLATTTALATKANAAEVTTSLATKVDKVEGKTLSTNDYSTAEKTKLAAITGTNTGDQDLSGYATTAALNVKANSSEVTTALATKANTADVTTSLATKVDKVEGKTLSTNDYTTAEKTKLAAITGTNTGDQDLSSYATTAALETKASSTSVTAGLELKENVGNKSTAADLGGTSSSDLFYPTQKAVKAYVAANAAAGSIADGGITTIKLADGAVTDVKVANGISKSKVGLSNVDNTADAAKPISTATQTALDTKANAATVTSDLATKVDKVAGKGLSTNDYSTDEKSKLAAIMGMNTGDQDLSGYATTAGLATKADANDVATSLATKVDKVAGKGLSTNDYSTDEKSKLAAIMGMNTGDQDLTGYATTIALETKASTASVTSALELKENVGNKSILTDLGGTSTSDVFYPTQKAVKTYVDAEVDAVDKVKVGLGNVDNTADALKPISTATQIVLDLKANTSDLTTGLGLKANLNSPTFTGTVSGITKAMVGLGDVDNTSDASKPVSTAMQSALNLKADATDVTTSLATKVDKVQGKELSTNDYTTAEKTKLAAIIGANTGDQDLTGYATTADLATMATITSVTSSLNLKEDVSQKSILTDLGGQSTSDALYPSQKAVKTYVDNQINNWVIADGSITSQKIADGTLVNADINASAGITFSKLNITKSDIEGLGIPGSDTNTTYTAGSGLALSSNSFSIGSGAVTSTHIADRAVTGSKLEATLTGYKNFADGAGKVIIAANLTPDLTPQVGSIATGGEVVWQSFVPGSSGKLGLIEFETINPTSAFGMMPPTAYVEIYSGSGIGGTLLGRSNDVTISMMGRSWKAFDFNGSTVELFVGVVYTAKLIASTSNQDWVFGDDNLYNFGISNVSSTWDHNFKTSLKLFSNDVFLTESAAQNLYGNLISNATHTGDVTGSTNLTITDGAVTTSKLANGAVDLASKVTGQLPSSNIADGAVTTDKINIGAITTVKIANNAVDLASKVSGQLPSANIADGAITSAKIGGSAVDLTAQVTGLLPIANGGTGINSATANSIFAAPNGSSGSPSFRALVAADIPQNLSGYIQNAPSSAQAASIHINGSVISGSIQNTPIGSTTPSTGAFTTLSSSGNASIGGTLGISGVATFTAAPILSSTTASRALFTNASKEMVSNAITGTGNVVMSASPTLTGTINLESFFTTSDVTVNGKAIGRGAGNLITNTVIGLDALTSNTTGEANIAIGSSSLKRNTIGMNNIGLGTLTLNFNTEGNNNFAAGYTALYRNTVGANNFAAGYSALNSNTTGSNNFAAGYSALNSNTTGSNNFAHGISSLNSNTTGSNNIAFGSNSLAYNTIGSNNFALGELSMFVNSSGNNNVGIGFNSLQWNSTGLNNFALGNSSLKNNTTGSDNISIGFETLLSNTDNNDNIAIGQKALRGLIDGGTNVAIGKNAGNNLNFGSNVIVIGADAQPLYNNSSNEITLGNSSISMLRSATSTITSLSDRRDKTDIFPIVEGIDFIKQLKPVTFTWDTRDKAKVGIKSAGFIAQDLLALQKASSIGDNLDLVSENNPEKLEARYANLLPVIVKAMQEQQAIIEQLKLEIEALKKLVKE